MAHKTLIELRNPAPYYANLLPELRLAAQSCGYALAVHGTMARDLDLIAAPWDDKCTSDKELAECISKAANGHILPTKTLKDGTSAANPTNKGHGRVAWTIRLDDRHYIDLSVAPKGKREITEFAKYTVANISDETVKMVFSNLLPDSDPKEIIAAAWNVKTRDEESLIKYQCMDWADDHTYLQGLCVKLGYSKEETEWDGYSVPGIKELADKLFAGPQRAMT
jgi:hypothetical protein